MEKELILFRGRLVSKGWPERFRAAQLETTYVIEGQAYPRIRYGREGWGATSGPCHDCGALRGELHVPGCDMERCPLCGGQAIACDCPEELEDAGGPLLH